MDGDSDKNASRLSDCRLRHRGLNETSGAERHTRGEGGRRGGQRAASFMHHGAVLRVTALQWKEQRSKTTGQCSTRSRTQHTTHNTVSTRPRHGRGGRTQPHLAVTPRWDSCGVSQSHHPSLVTLGARIVERRRPRARLGAPTHRRSWCSAAHVEAFHHQVLLNGLRRGKRSRHHGHHMLVSLGQRGLPTEGGRCWRRRAGLVARTPCTVFDSV